MRGKSMILIVIALGCGLVASIGISQILDQSGNTPKVNTKKIYVAVRDVDISEVFDASMIKLEEWPAEKIPEGATTKLEEVQGLAPNQRLYAGEPIRKVKLVDPAKAGGKAFLIPKGYRVQAVRVNSEDVVGNLISPGDHVDVHVYLRKGGNIPESSTKTILEDVRVFAVNAETSKETSDDGRAITAKTVSLLVEPPQLQTLLLASRTGQISLSLRHPDDDSKSTFTSGAGLAQLLNSPSESATPKSSSPRPAAAAARTKSAAVDFTKFLDGLNSLAGSANRPPLQAAKSFNMEVLTRDGIVTYQLQDSHQMSQAQVVMGPVASAGAILPMAADDAHPAGDRRTSGEADNDGDDDSTGGSEWNPGA